MQWTYRAMALKEQICHQFMSNHSTKHVVKWALPASSTWEIHVWKIGKLQSDNWTMFHWKVISSNLNFEVAKEFGSPWFPQSSGDVPFCWGSTILEKVCRYPFDIQYTSAKTYLRNDKMNAKLTSICCCNLPSKASITRELSIAEPHVRAW